MREQCNADKGSGDKVSCLDGTLMTAILRARSSRESDVLESEGDAPGCISDALMMSQVSARMVGG